MSKVRIEPSYTSKYESVELWWDDITEIFEILQRHATSVEIETSTYKYSTLDAAKEHLAPGANTGVRISSSSPYVSLSDARLHVGAGPVSAEVFLELDAILKKRSRGPRWLYSGYLAIPALTLGVVPLSSIDQNAKTIALIVQATFCVLFLRAVYYTTRKSFVVHTVKRSDSAGFFRRNRDQIFMYLITFVLGGILTFAGLQIKEYVLPSATQTQK